MTEITAIELRTPEDPETDRALDGYVTVTNTLSQEFWGSDEFDVTTPEMATSLAPNEDEFSRRFVWFVDRVPSGKSALWHDTDDDATTVYAFVGVLPDARGQGLGQRIADHIEAAALELSPSAIVAWIDHRPADGDGLLAATGHGRIVLDAGARFALARGYALEQVERVSRLDILSARPSLVAHRHEAARHAGADYALESWSGPTPDQRRDGLAALMARMSTDAPSGALEVDLEHWDAARLERLEARTDASGKDRLTSVVVHRPTGEVVAYTVITVPWDPDAQVYQDDTLVHADHRGHRLGMLAKAANLLQLGEFAPERARIVTWNAEENVHMLNVNVALGFAPIAAEGAWQRRVTPRTP